MQAPQRPAPMPPLPLTQLERARARRDLDNRTFSLTFAQPVPVKDLLLLLVRGTNLSVVPDPAIQRRVHRELKNVTVRQALGLILRPLGLDYSLAQHRGACSGARRRPGSSISTSAVTERGRVQHRAAGGRGPHRRERPTSTKSERVPELANGVRMLLTEAAPASRRPEGRAAAGDRFSRAARSRGRIYLETCRIACTARYRPDGAVIEVRAEGREGLRVDWAVASRSR